MSNLQQYQADIIIDNNTGESFTSQRGLARICGVHPETIQRFANRHSFETKTAEVLTTQGLRTVTRYEEKVIAKAIQEFNPTLAEQLMQLGVRTLLHKLAGYEVKSTAVEQKPMSQAELALWTVQTLVEQEARIQRLEAFAPLKDYYTITAWLNLHPEAEKPKHYPSCGKALVKLSAEMNVEVKSVPDNKYGSCNAYHTSVLKTYFN